MSSILPRIGALDGGTVRRALLLVAVAALVATAGCSGVLSDDEGPSGDPIDSVPEDQDLLVHVDMSLMEDQTTTQVADSLAEEETSQEDFQDALDEFENETGLDATGVGEILMYGSSEDLNPTPDADAQDQFGFVVHSDWSEDDLVSALNEEDDGELVATSYQGEDVLYEPTGSMADEEDPMYLGVLGDGAFVFGTEQAVKSSLDVEYGGADSLSGPLRDTYENSRDGYVTFAMVMPEEDTGAGGGMGSSMADSVETMSAVYYTESGDVGLEGRIATTDEESAQQIQGAISLAMGEFTQQEGPTADVLNEIETEQDGSAVLITYQQDADELIEALQALEDQQTQTL